MTSKPRLEFNVSAPKVADREWFPESRKPQNLFQSEGLHSKNADHIFSLAARSRVLDLALLENSLRSLSLISSNLLTPQRSLPFLRDAVGLDFAEAIGPVRISRRRKGAFHDKRRAIP